MSDGFVPIFNGRTLDGLHTIPRLYGPPRFEEPAPDDPPGLLPADYEQEAIAHPAHWEIVDGAIEGFQDPQTPGYGGYLVTDDSFADFELQLEMKPDWPADTGVMVRYQPAAYAGFQVLVDHRKSGSIGGFYGNGTGGFHGVPYILDAVTDEEDRPVDLRLEDPRTTLEPMTPDKVDLLSRRGDPDNFLSRWHFGDWNHLRIRCIGAKPVITTWVNDVLVAEIDLATLKHPDYDADEALAALGHSGHIAFEVHDNDPLLGERRWARGARCRWRNIEVKDL